MAWESEATCLTKQPCLLLPVLRNGINLQFPSQGCKTRYLTLLSSGQSLSDSKRDSLRVVGSSVLMGIGAPAPQPPSPTSYEGTSNLWKVDHLASRWSARSP